MNYENITVIGFDADDTLWVNETYFREAEVEFSQLMQAYETINKVDQELYKVETVNIPIYGFGVKGFILSMIETALKLSNYQASNQVIESIINIGKEMFDKPVELLDGVEKTLELLSKKYRLIVATKGDLLDQEKKLKKSGLIKYFHHIEILSDKKEQNYSELLKHLEIDPKSFLMVGNSLKSDVLPVIAMGAQAIHVPYHTTWQHERVHHTEIQNAQYRTLDSISELMKLV